MVAINSTGSVYFISPMNETEYVIGDERFSIYCNWQSMRDMQNIARRGCNLEALGLLLRAIAVLRKRIKDSILKIRSHERH